MLSYSNTPQNLAPETTPRGLVCEECKRLKLRCDRNIPCSSCVRRRCEHVCPGNTIPRVQAPGRRLLLTDTRDLHVKLDAMRDRLAELENAIAAHNSAAGHNSGRDSPTRSNLQDPTDSDDISDIFGTLTVGDVSDFMGPNASADSLLYRKNKRELLEHSECMVSELVVAHCALGPAFSPNTLSMLSELPLRSDAYLLADMYFNEISWMTGGARREDVSALLDRLYRNTPDAGRPKSLNDVDMHDLALLFSIFSITSHLQSVDEGMSYKVRRYMSMMRACLSIDSCVERVTLQSIRALHIASWTQHLTEDPYSTTSSYNLAGLVAGCCRTIGLHRDDASWSLPYEERQARRELMWDIAMLDTSLAEFVGRPSSWPISHIDARLPVDQEAFVDDGEWQQSYSAWNRSFVSSCVLRVFDQGFCARPRSYQSILHVDRTIREHPISRALRATDTRQEDVSPKLVLQRTIALLQTQKALLYLHRSFFARAMLEHPEDPLVSTFQPSVLASFRAALYLTANARTVSDLAPSVPFPCMWSTAFSACVVLGSIVIRSVSCALAQTAWLEFVRVLDTFERLAPRSQTLSRVMPNLRLLYKKATTSWNTAQGTGLGPAKPLPVALDDTEMAFIYGVKRFDQTSAEADSIHPYPQKASTGVPSASSAAHGLQQSDYEMLDQQDVLTRDVHDSNDSISGLDDDAWESLLLEFGLDGSAVPFGAFSSGCN